MENGVYGIRLHFLLKVVLFIIRIKAVEDSILTLI